MQLYAHPLSTTSRAILLFEAESDLKVDLRTVDLSSGEHQRERFLSVSPNGLVPVLIDGGLRLMESSAILKYLAHRTGSSAVPINSAYAGTQSRSPTISEPRCSGWVKRSVAISPSTRTSAAGFGPCGGSKVGRGCSRRSTVWSARSTRGASSGCDRWRARSARQSKSRRWGQHGSGANRDGAGGYT
jgi:hypothetical protein